MDSETIKKAQEALLLAEEDYQILQNAENVLSVKERFDLSQTI